MPSLEVPANTWEPTTAKLMMATYTVAAASAHPGSLLLVSLDQWEVVFGSLHFALQKAVAARVRETAI